MELKVLVILSLKIIHPQIDHLIKLKLMANLKTGSEVGHFKELIKLKIR